MHTDDPLDETGSPSQPSQARIISGFWRRLAAFLIDITILGTIGLLLGLVLFDFFVRIEAWGLLLGFGIALLYFGILNSSIAGGQTIGKRIMKIRVADSSGETISLGRSLVRFTILGVPFFLNGAAIPELANLPILAFISGLIVFGGYGAIIYLYVFNRKTRQSLHDLTVGTFVIRSAAHGNYISPVWKGHFAVVGLWLISVIVFMLVIMPKLRGYGPIPDLLSLQKTIESSQNVYFATATVGTTWWSQGGKKVSATYLTTRVFTKKEPADFKKAAAQIAAIVLAKYPKAMDRQALSISVTYGYDIGIAHSWRSFTESHSPAEWGQLLAPRSTQKGF